MRKRFFLLGMGAILLAFALVLASCDMGTTCTAGGDCHRTFDAQGRVTAYIMCDRRGGGDNPTCMALRMTGTSTTTRGCDC